MDKVINFCSCFMVLDMQKAPLTRHAHNYYNWLSQIKLFPILNTNPKTSQNEEPTVTKKEGSHFHPTPSDPCTLYLQPVSGLRTLQTHNQTSCSTDLSTEAEIHTLRNQDTHQQT
jgi:hypothetical protein